MAIAYASRKGVSRDVQAGTPCRLHVAKLQGQEQRRESDPGEHKGYRSGLQAAHASEGNSLDAAAT